MALTRLYKHDHPKDEEMQRRTFELRKSLVLLRRVVLPMREVLHTVLRRDLHVVDEHIVPYFHDVYDHVLRVTEWTESLRDLVTTILETHLTVRGDRILRTECAVPRFRAYFGFLGFLHPPDRAVRGAVRHVPAQGLAVTGWRAARPEFAAQTRNRVTRVSVPSGRVGVVRRALAK